MKPLYKNLLIIGIAMGVIATSLIVGVGQTLIMELGRLEQPDGHYYLYHAGEENSMRGMPLPLATEVQSWLDRDINSAVIALSLGSTSLRIGDEFLSATLVGTDQHLPEVYQLNVAKGRFFSADDVAQKGMVAVVTSDIHDLFPDATELFINDQPFEIIGATQGNIVVEDTIDFSQNSIYLPITSWYQIVRNSPVTNGFINNIAIYAPNHSQKSLQQQISKRLVDMPNAPALTIQRPGRWAREQATRSMITLSLVFGVAFIVLLLAGLNIIQVASASVYDRQRVFGLKVALGATPRHIGEEICKEVLSCSLQGGYIGVVFASVVNTLINRWVGTYWASFSLGTAVIGIILALLVGLTTSLIPARKAATVNPVTVLRQQR